MSLHLESMKYCPVGGVAVDDGFDYCPKPEHKGVLLVRVYSYKPGTISLSVAGSYDIEHDDFGLDDGVSKADMLFDQLSEADKELIESAGMDKHQFYELFKSEHGKHPADYPHPAPTTAHEQPPADSPPEPETVQVKPASSGYTQVKSYIIKVKEPTINQNPTQFGSRRLRTDG